jgi:hypothetical protein
MDLSSIVREPGLLFLISQYLDSMLTGFDAFSRVAAVSKDWLHAFQGDDMHVAHALRSTMARHDGRMPSGWGL